MYSRLDYSWEKDLVKSLKKQKKQNVKSGLRNIIIGNAKNFIAIQNNKALRALKKIYWVQYR